MTPDIQTLNLASPTWEEFDPKSRLTGEVEYPDQLTGKVEFLRTFNEGPWETESGSVGLSVLHMEGDPTEWGPDKTNAETEFMILLEGSAEARVSDGRELQIEAPLLVLLPRGITYRWRYLTPYRGIYIIIW